MNKEDACCIVDIVVGSIITEIRNAPHTLWKNIPKINTTSSNVEEYLRFKNIAGDLGFIIVEESIGYIHVEENIGL